MYVADDFFIVKNDEERTQLYVDMVAIRATCVPYVPKLQQYAYPTGRSHEGLWYRSDLNLSSIRGRG